MKDLFNLGDIVALKSHPYATEHHKILVSGEPLLISPMMVIVEIINDLQDVHDEFTGVNLQTKGKTSSCKCLWYSSKSSQFEEAWLSSKLLKLIKKRENELSKNQAIGTIVTLSTAQLELSKVKSSYKIEGGKERASLTPMLSFVSPLMQVIGTPRNEKKESLFDVKTGAKKKEISEQLVKCKWFNPASDKMSETLIPIEALDVIPSIDEQMLNDFSSYIEENQHLTITIERIPYQTIFLPQTIKYVHGRYFIVGYDYIKNQPDEFEISKLSVIKLGSPFVGKAPNFKDIKQNSLSLTEQIREVIEEGVNECKYLRIKYNDKNNNITLRTIRDSSIEIVPFDGNQTAFLKAFCELRNAERYFQISRIQSVEILNFTYPVPKVKKVP